MNDFVQQRYEYIPELQNILQTIFIYNGLTSKQIVKNCIFQISNILFISILFQVWKILIIILIL